MRVVGYVREGPGSAEGDNAYGQTERIRRFVSEGGHQLVAVCQDIRQPGHALGREGYLSMLGILASDQVDGVLIASLASLSPDKINQEILLWDLRTRKAAVLSADSTDVAEMTDPPADGSRRLVRDILSRIGEHFVYLDQALSTPMPIEPQHALAEGEPAATDIIVELLPAEERRA